MARFRHALTFVCKKDGTKKSHPFLNYLYNSLFVLLVLMRVDLIAYLHIVFGRFLLLVFDCFWWAFGFGCNWSRS